MKTNLLQSALALVALCSALTLHAENKAVAARGFAGEVPVDQVAAITPVNGDTVTVGTTRIMVSLRLGSPNAVLADGSWLYSGYTARHDGAALGQPGTLVVRFIAHKVTSLSVADQTTVVALRQTPRRTATDNVLAANQPR